MKALNSKAKHIFFVGGVGSGKTFVIPLFAYKWIINVPGSIGILLAPTYDTLKNSTLQGVQDVFENHLNLTEGVHYVIGTKPPPYWDVKAFSQLHNQRIMTFANGSYLLLETAENYNKHRGAEFDYIIMDEWRDIKDGAYEVMTTRTRGKRAKALGLKTQILNTTTPPDDPDRIEKFTLNHELDCEIITTTTMDNLQNLPVDYLNTLKTTLDPITYKREVLGEAIRQGNLAAWAYDKNRNIELHSFNPSLKTALIFDFDTNPQVILLNQLIGISNKGNPKWCIVKEFIFRPGNTETATNEIFSWLRSQGFNAELILTGDYSGIAKRTNSNYSDWVMIENIAEIFGFNSTTKIMPTQSLRDSLNALNALLYNYEGDVRQVISPECKYTIKDVAEAILTQTVHGLRIEHGINNEKSHAIACLADFAKNLYPIRKEYITLQK